MSNATPDVEARNSHPYGPIIAATEYLAGAAANRSGFATMSEVERAEYLYNLSYEFALTGEAGPSPRRQMVSRAVETVGSPYPPVGVCGGYANHDAYLDAMSNVVTDMVKVREFVEIAATNTRTMARLSHASIETKRMACVRCVYAHVYLAERLSSARVLFFPPEGHRCFDTQCMSRRALWQRVLNSGAGEVVTTSMYNTTGGVRVNPPVHTAELHARSNMDADTIALVDAVANMMRGDVTPGGGFVPLQGCDPINVITRIARGISLKVYNSVVRQMCEPFRGSLAYTRATPDTDISTHVPVHPVSASSTSTSDAPQNELVWQFFVHCASIEDTNRIATLFSQTPAIYCVARNDSRPSEFAAGTFLTGVVIFSTPIPSLLIQNVFPDAIVIQPTGDVGTTISIYKNTAGYIEYNTYGPTPVEERDLPQTRNVAARTSEDHACANDARSRDIDVPPLGRKRQHPGGPVVMTRAAVAAASRGRRSKRISGKK